VRRTARLGSLLAVLTAVALAPLPGRSEEPPQTAFEASGGVAWTTHDEELEFLHQVDARSPRVELEVIGHTEDGRPMHLVKLGYPRPRTAAAARGVPVELHLCTQHGNEAAGREACLQVLRDLTFTADPELLEQLGRTTILFVPTANPDGRDADQRENLSGVDINRDHLNLESPEARTMARVVRDWQPDLAIDHHEYGPGTPVLYDDEVLYLWPRNLNVDEDIRTLGMGFTKEFLSPCLADQGYSSDEYGVDAAGDTDVQQTAGDGDEGIARNLMGLRHTVGILIESGVTQNLLNGPGEVMTAENQKRRVASHVATIGCTLEWMRGHAPVVAAAQQASIRRKIAEGRDRSAPVYFQGQDEDTTAAGNAPETIQGEAPCAYDLTAAQAAELREVFDLQGIVAEPRPGGGVRVSMAQAAEPVIPLLLDTRNEDRAATDGTPVDSCGTAAAPVVRPRPAAPQARPAPRLPATGVPDWLGEAALLAIAGALALRPGRTIRWWH
jgi:hypothetical protein